MYGTSVYAQDKEMYFELHAAKSFCKEHCVKTKLKETEHVTMSAASKHVHQQSFKIFCTLQCYNFSE